VLLYEVSHGVATITINRPTRRNALTEEVIDGLITALTRAKSDTAVRTVVLTGAGESAFCAGADLAGLGAVAALEMHDRRGRMADVFRAMYSLGKPTIARVRGYALAGGFGLALACDIVIAAGDAVFGAPEIGVGMWPMLNTVPMLRSMSAKTVLELQMTGRRVTADEALRLGFVSRVVPPDTLDQVVADVASDLASRSPAIMRIGRDAFYRTASLSLDDALAYLQLALGLVMQTEDSREGISAFTEKRTPEWRGL
jgi:enoyl-CoA hydratase/carnithine racemase